MNSDLNNRDFEQFVQQNADQYRMFPSEKVWEGVHSALHKRRRWFGFGLALLLITAAIVTGVMLVPGSKDRQQSNLPAGTVTTNFPENGNTNNSTATTPESVSTQPVVIPAVSNNNETSSSLNNQKNIVTNYNIIETYRISNQQSSTNSPQNTRSTTGSDLSVASPVNSHQDITGIAAAKPGMDNNTVSADIPAAALIPSYQPSALTDALLNHPNNTAAEAKKIALSDFARTDESELYQSADKDISKNKAGRKKLTWSVYMAPTVSYRSLTENQEYLSAARYNNIVNGGVAVAYPSDIKNNVNHRPDLGFQLGLRANYPVSQWFSLTGGIQLGISKYDIRGTEQPAEQATIALSNRNVAAVSTFRNAGSYKQSWLQSFSVYASLPVGIELKLSDGDKNYFGIGGTLQPTYVIDNRSYLLSADLKNYAEVPSLTRKWNMNTSFEIFSAHTSGKVKWRIGPVVQYQAMSSFKKNYPIKEHLTNFGLKLGIQLK